MTDQTDEKRPITAEDLYQLQLITGGQLSPDGRFVIYSQQRVDKATEKKYTNLWLVETAGGTPRQFTYGQQNDVAPQWSPDGQSVGFLSNRGNEQQMQIYQIPLFGGEARPITSLEGGISHFEWAPDGQKIALILTKKDAEAKEREEDEQKKNLGIVGRHITQVQYRFDGVGYLPKEKPHIWVVDVASGEASQLTDGIYGESGVTWSPDSQQLLFVSTRTDNWEFDIDGSELYLIPATGGDPQQVKAHHGGKYSPSFSPDGRYIAYHGSRINNGHWYQNPCLFVTPVDPADGDYRNLTADKDLYMGNTTLGDFGSPAPESRATWSPDSRYLYAHVSHHGGNPLARIDVASGEIEYIIDDGNSVGFFSFDQTHSQVAYFYASLFDPCQLHLRQLDTDESKALTSVNRELLDQINFGEVEEVWFKGPDDNNLHGWILTPPDFDPSQTYPSILEIHGGPQTQYGRVFMHEFYYFASQGYVVYWSNPRGGQGYGEEHAGAIYGKWNTVDTADVCAWADYVSEKPFIDQDRMGITGGSYGGYMTMMVIAQDQRFKAAVPQRMLSNWVSFHGTADFNWGAKYLLGIEGEPWNNLSEYWDMSPMSLIGQVETPTLVIHSEADYRCSKEQAEQVFVALKVRGIPTEMVLFPDENHGLSRGGRTDRRISRLNHILRWFDKYLK